MKIIVPPLRWYVHLLDRLMKPFMYLAAGTIWESPQETHWWNNIHFPPQRTHYLQKKKMVSRPGLSFAKPRWLWKIPLFHIQVFGGWRDYVVLRPVAPCKEWYVGWVADDAIGISQLRLTGAVRVLRGDKTAQWFGVDAEGCQITLKAVGKGRVGAGGRFAHLPLR